MREAHRLITGIALSSCCAAGNILQIRCWFQTECMRSSFVSLVIFGRCVCLRGYILRFDVAGYISSLGLQGGHPHTLMQIPNHYGSV